MALRGTRERAVLALLLLSANRVVPSARLATDLWGDRLPEGATHALQVHVSRLRKAVQGAGGEGMVVTRSPGYLLRVAPGALDALRFEALVAQAQELTAQGDHHRAAMILREALGLWRGPALADVADAPLAQAEAARLDEARLAALEKRVEADLACGQHGELVAELDALTRSHPFRERLWGLRMLALYRAGRQVEALRAYQELRGVLGELGVTPSASLVRLEAAILRHNQELDWPPIGKADVKEAGAGARLVEGQTPITPMPAFLTETGRIFAGRERELEWLEQLWKGAEAGELRLALVSGEPGVGKTRLAAELAGRVHAEGAVVLAGRCDEDLGVPYQPFVEALHHLVEHAATGELSQRLGRHGGELVRLAPELGERVRDLPPPLQSDPETERYRLFDAVAAWLGAGEQPVLLVLDDLQWATKPTLLLLRHVVRSPQLRQLLVVGIYRDTDLSHQHPLVELLADLRRQGGVERLSLSGLDHAGVVSFMEQTAGHDLDDEDLLFAQAIYEETEGNPFFVREILRHLTEIGAVEQREGRWVTRLPLEQLGIPEGVREVVGRRLSHLSGETNRVLQLAAVVGPKFELRVIQQAEGVDEENLLLALEQAHQARLVIEITGSVPRYRFTHALVRDTLYAELSAARRAVLHRRVAQAIEAVHAGRLDDYLPALAHHFARASGPAAETEKAVTYATRAGDRALAQLAHHEAVAYYRQALEFLDVAGGLVDETGRLELLLALGDAQRRAGEPAYRETLLEAGRLARERGDAEALGRAALSNSRAMFMGNFGSVDAERVEILEAALAAVGEADTPVRARLLATLALELTYAGQGDRHHALSDEAVVTARRVGDPATLTGVLLARCYTKYTPATLAERLANTAEALELAEHLEDPVMRCRAALLRIRCLADIGDRDESAACLEVAERLAAELNQPALLWTTAWNRVGRLVQPGRLDEAERAAYSALEIGEACGQPDALLFFSVQTYCIRREQSRVGEIEEMIREAADRWPMFPLLRIFLAHAYCEQRREADTRTIFDPLAADRFTGLPFDITWLTGLSILTDIAVDLRETAAAAVLYDLLSPYADQVATTNGVPGGAGSHYLGRLAGTLNGFQEAEAHFIAAVAAHQRMGAPTWLARTRLEWARMLLTRRGPGDTERARELLGQALAAARQLGLGGIEGQALMLLS